MTKEELREHLISAPQGTTPGSIIKSLRAQGVQMEGDPTPAQVNPFNPFAGKQPEGGSLLGNIKSSIENRGNNIAEIGQNLYGDGSQAPSLPKMGSAILQATGELTGGVNDVFNEPVKQVISPVVGIFDSWAQAHPQAASSLGSATNFLKQSLTQAVTGLNPENQNQLSQAFSQATTQLAKEHPEASRNLAALGEIAKFAGTVSGTEQIGNQLGLGKRLDMAALKDANAYAQKGLSNPNPMTDMNGKVLEPSVKSFPIGTQPKVTQEEIFNAAKRGDVQTNISGEPIGLKVNKSQEAISDSLQKAGITKKMSPVQATTKAQSAIAETGKVVEKDIAANNYAFNDNELKGVFQSATRQAVDDAVITTSAEKKVFDTVGNAYQKKFQSILQQPLAEGGAGGNRLLAVEKTRKIMDKLAPPKTFAGDAVMNAKVNAFRYFRDGLNEFVGSTLEANGSPYSSQKKYMTNLFRGLDNLETLTPKELAPTLGKKVINAAKKSALPVAATALGLESVRRLTQ